MTQVRFLTDLTGFELQAVFWVSLLFCVAVSFIWPWWKTDLGVGIIVKTAALAAVTLPWTLHELLGVGIGGLSWLWVSVVALAAVIFAIVWRFIVIWVLQRYEPPPVKSGRAAWGRARGRRQRRL